MKNMIYIPIWLDLLSLSFQFDYYLFKDLHSNMIRFIIQPDNCAKGSTPTFTFQYG